MNINAGDNYSFTGAVPDNAWEQYAKLTKTTGDTAASDEYPADAGYRKNNATYNFGTETAMGKSSVIGIRGFLYVGNERGLVFFDNNIDNIPVLNSVLRQISWEEVPNSPDAWP